MTPWKQFPFIKLTLALIAGIVPGMIFTTAPLAVIWHFLAFLLPAIVVFLPKKTITYRYRWLPGVTIFLYLAFLSWTMTCVRQDERPLNHLKGNQVLCIADVAEPVVQKKRSVKLVLELHAYREREKWVKKEGKILLYVQKDSMSENLFYGDRILFRCRLNEPLPAMNPGGFDSRRYLRYKGIFLQSYARGGDWRLLGRNEKNPVVAAALNWRDRMLEVFRESGLTGREYAVASALLLGYTDDIDQELMQEYSATGAMHILSVSGMHVGVIYIFIEKMLAFLNRRRRGILVKSTLSVLLVWLYALITGLSPAVLRAASMIALVIIAGSFRRQTSILNILGISAFFLLAWDPGLLFDTGFLLSYLAVGGIVLLYEPIRNLWIPVHPFPEKIWSLIAVSLAAQLATFPACLYFFHQFPNYFLLTNLVVVPFSNFVIYTGIFCLISGPVHILSPAIGWLLGIMVKYMNAAIIFIGNLPFAVTGGIFLSFTEMMVLYLVLILLVAYFLLKKKRWIFFALAAGLFFSGMMLIKAVDSAGQKGVIVYSVKGSCLIDCYDRDCSVIFGNTQLLEDPFLAQTIQRNHQSAGISREFHFRMIPGEKTGTVFRFGGHLIKTDHCIVFYGRKICIVDSKPVGQGERRIRTDVLILSTKERFSIPDLLEQYGTRKLVIDGSVPVYRAAQWLRQSDSLGISVHSVKNNGAFLYEF